MFSRPTRKARAAVSRLRLSFFVGVALVPLLVNEVFVGIGHLLSWWGWSLLLVGVIAVLFGIAWWAEHRLESLQAVVRPGVRGVQDLRVVTDLVLTVDLTKSSPQNLHTVLPLMPNVKRMYALVGEGAGAPADAEQVLARFVREAGRDDVSARLLAELPVHDLEPEAIDGLQRTLAGLAASLGPAQVPVVDITGGTVPMSLTTYRAAVAAEVPVTYTTTTAPQSREQKARQFRGMVALYDPVGELTGAVTGTEIV